MVVDCCNSSLCTALKPHAYDGRTRAYYALSPIPKNRWVEASTITRCIQIFSSEPSIWFYIVISLNQNLFTQNVLIYNSYCFFIFLLVLMNPNTFYILYKTSCLSSLYQIDVYWWCTPYGVHNDNTKTDDTVAMQL